MSDRRFLEIVDESYRFLCEARYTDYKMIPKFMEFNKKYFNGEVPIVELKWNSRLKKAGGQTSSTYNRETGVVTPISIDLATYIPDIINEEYVEEYYDSILLHEMVHAWVDVHKGRVKPHGHEFKMKMMEVIRKANIRFLTPAKFTITYIPPELRDKVLKPKDPTDRIPPPPKKRRKRLRTLPLSILQRIKKETGKYPTPEEVEKILAKYNKLAGALG